MGIHIFLQLFGMACKLPVALKLNTDMRSVAFRLFNLHYFFLTPYFIVSR